MEKDEGAQRSSSDRCRQTTYGLTSHEHSKIQQYIQKIVNCNDLSFSILIPALEKNPIIREETDLLEAIFRKRQMVEDMIRFLLVPRQMSAKYQLTTEQTKKYIKAILTFMKDNEQFYEFYFLLLEENSELYSEKYDGQHKKWKRKPVQSKEGTLGVWFQFLEDRQSNRDEFQASLGYFAEIFIPFVKFYFSESSRICDYYEETYEMAGPIWLITHFYESLISNVLKYTHHQPIFDCLFTLVRVSIDEQEWIDSLDLLKKLCQSCVANGVTSDDHIEYLYQMVKQVRDNISKDKNGTVFAFLDGIVSSGLVSASIKRLEILSQKCEEDDEIIIETNFKFLMEITHIYHTLLEIGISKTTNSMQMLRAKMIKIRNNLPKMFLLAKNYPELSINFSNGQNLTSTPMFIYYFFQMCRYLLLSVRDYCQGDAELGLQEFNGDFLMLIQNILAENRWSSIMHSIIQKLVTLIVTTELFKANNTTLKSFLEFLIEAFANKKYVFLNSCRMVNQGDLKSLYYICCKITKSFEGACKTFGVNNEYSQWQQFIVNVLKNYETKSQKSVYLPYQDISQSADLSEGSPSPGKDHSFLGYIDEADEAAQIKRSIDKIDTIQKWKNSNQNTKKTNIQRSGSIPHMELIKKGQSSGQIAKRETTMSPNTVGRQRSTIPEPKVYKSGLGLRNIKKQSSVEIHQGQMTRPFQMQRILSVQKEGYSSESDTEGKVITAPVVQRKRSSKQ